MLFNSLDFAVFLPIVACLYYLCTPRFRWALLLAASCYFYMVFVPYYILILFAVILVDYIAGIMIAKLAGGARRLALILSLAANIGILFFFKYFNFFDANVAALARLLHWNYSMSTLSIVLPIGLSFHTFQSMAYTVEVYRGRQAPERHLGIYALYVLFFPQLVAGPIERPQHLLPQFHAVHHFDRLRLWEGLHLIASGLFKKMVIADQLADFVNAAFDRPGEFTGAQLLVATYFFAFQIFCDFAGYSDIARGSARILGFDLCLNFDRPYFATSVSDFWRRWHISLSTWFRDYVYIPLGGNKVGAARHYVNLMIVFVLSGLWHGANWTFLVWGALHGFFLIMAKALAPARSAVAKSLGWKPDLWIGKLLSGLVVFNLVTLAWVFFRARNVETALAIMRKIASAFSPWSLLTGLAVSEFVLSLVLISVLIVASIIHSRVDLSRQILRLPRPARLTLYAVCLLLFAAFVVTNNPGSQRFIYFQF